MTRFLRPDRIIRGADATWLVDEAWPVAAMVQVAHPPTCVAWSWSDSPVGSGSRVVVADGVGFVSGLGSEVPTGVHPNRHTWTWLTEDPNRLPRDGVMAGGLMWDVGAPTGTDKINRDAVAVGYDPSGSRPPVRVDLGLGLIRDAQAVDDELWVVVARRRFLAVPLDRGVDVLAVSASGASRTVLAADTFDVSGSAPPLSRPSDEQVHEHIEAVRSHFDNLETY